MLKRILIVDDSSSNILLLSNFLESEGYEVSTSFSGKDALIQIGKNCPDLVLLDLMMPNIDGLTVLKSIRSNPTTTKLPVIVISAVGEDDKIQEVKSHIITDYIVKPIDFDIIFEKVKMVLGE